MVQYFTERYIINLYAKYVETSIEPYVRRLYTKYFQKFTVPYNCYVYANLIELLTEQDCCSLYANYVEIFRDSYTTIIKLSTFKFCRVLLSLPYLKDVQTAQSVDIHIYMYVYLWYGYIITKCIHNAFIMLKTYNNIHPYIHYCYPQYRST